MRGAETQRIESTLIESPTEMSSCHGNIRQSSYADEMPREQIVCLNRARVVDIKQTCWVVRMTF